MTFKPTNQDREILYAYARGASDRHLARILDTTESYAGTLGMRMRRRMGAENRAHAVSIAYQLGILGQCADCARAPFVAALLEG